MVQQLQIVLGVDNKARKDAEQHLSKIREGEPEKYACYLASIIQDSGAPAEIRSLAAVILRRNLGTVVGESKKTLWEALNETAKDWLRTTLLTTIKSAALKDLAHKFANLLVEVAGCMYEENEAVW